MTPGTLLFAPHFRFHDGGQSPKILVVLGTRQGVTLIVKTTSQSARFRNDWGCQVDHRYPNFHLVQGCCYLTKPTWVCLDEYYEFKESELLQQRFSGDLAPMATLPDSITVELMECALRSDDISPCQMKIVEAALACFESSASEDE